MTEFPYMAFLAELTTEPGLEESTIHYLLIIFRFERIEIRFSRSKSSQNRYERLEQ